MKLFGFEISRKKQLQTPLAPPPGRGGWYPVIREPFTGAWQQNVELRVESLLTYTPLFRCVAVISSDVAKLRLMLVSEDANGIWTEVDVAAFSPVLRKPNDYQSRLQFIAQWMESKLIYGNTYVLKQRDNRGVVTRLTIADPSHVTVLVAADGSVFYELRGNFNLSGIIGSEISIELADQGVVRVPARDIIHDRYNTFFHPLVGLSPIYACGLPATQGLAIQSNSTNFFGNASRPSALLIAPGAIADESAAFLKQFWADNFSGAKAGNVAVLSDGLKYEQLEYKAVDTQLIEQAKWSAEMVCMAFGVPRHKLGLASETVGNVEALQQQYYAECLQSYIEAIESCLNEGLELPNPYATRFNLDDLLRMDTSTLVKSLAEAVGAGIMSPDEARLRLNLAPVKGGGSPYLQQQNFSLAALAERDRNDPFAKPAPAPPADSGEEDDELVAAFIADLQVKADRGFTYA